MRCGQPAGKWGLSTFVWVPDEMTEQEFAALCDQASSTYLNNERTFKNAAPPPFPPTVESYPAEMTLAAIRADRQKFEDAYKAHTLIQKEARKSFNELLREASGGTIQYLWNGPVAFSHDLSWGHNHGLEVDYSETKSGDFPPDADEDENYV